MRDDIPSSAFPKGSVMLLKKLGDLSVLKDFEAIAFGEPGGDEQGLDLDIWPAVIIAPDGSVVAESHPGVAFKLLGEAHAKGLLNHLCKTNA